MDHCGNHSVHHNMKLKSRDMEKKRVNPCAFETGQQLT